MPMAENVAKPSRPRLAPAGYDEGVQAGLRLAIVKNPRARSTLGDVGAATRVSGPVGFAPVLLVQALDPRGLVGIDQTSVRMFRNDGRTLRPVWASGINVALGFAWAKIDRPGIYVVVGLPRDRFLQALLGELALRRRYAD